MQYKEAKKIIIDKHKLEILIRLGCPDSNILSIIKTGKFEKTGDSLIDETLECLCDFKSFKNWGGNHNPLGINGSKITKNRGQVDHQVDHQVDGQVVDKDKDKDKDKEEDIDKDNIYYLQFENFWSLYTPIKSREGNYVAKGNKQKCYKKFVNLMKEGVKYETIIGNLEKYLQYCRKNGYCSCGVEVYLNQRRFENDYGQSECVDSEVRDNQRRPVSIVKIADELAKESRYDDSDSIPF